MSTEKEVAKILLDVNAVKLNPEEPFTYVSGIRSPIYCDNRVLTFFVDERRKIVSEFVEKIKDLDCDVIAGTASSAISWGAWVAEVLGKPMVYIRKKSKGYGADKLIEGGDVSGKKVIVVEDLITTGGSSVNAALACKEAGAEVVKVVAIFQYEFEKAVKKFEEAGFEFITLSSFDVLVEVAKETGAVAEDKIDMVLEWRKNPPEWGPAHGFPNAEPKNG